VPAEEPEQNARSGQGQHALQTTAKVLLSAQPIVLEFILQQAWTTVIEAAIEAKTTPTSFILFIFIIILGHTEIEVTNKNTISNLRENVYQASIIKTPEAR
jgi:hypothetical protein